MENNLNKSQSDDDLIIKLMDDVAKNEYWDYGSFYDFASQQNCVDNISKFIIHVVKEFKNRQ